MYENIGKKIKGFAKAAFVIEAIASVIGGFVLLAEDADMVFFALLAVAGGIAAALISSWFIYGFGELIDKVCAIESHMRGEESQQPRINLYYEEEPIEHRNDERRQRLERMRAEGLISEEEYQQAMLNE